MSGEGEEDEVETESHVVWTPFKRFTGPPSYDQGEPTPGATLGSWVIETCFKDTLNKETSDEQSGQDSSCQRQLHTLPAYLSSNSPVNQEFVTASGSLFRDRINHNGADVWYSLMDDRPVTINKYATCWWWDFIRSLFLDDKVGKTFDFDERDNSHHIDDSSGKPDPMYSGFVTLQNGFFVCGDGHVFRSKKEVDAFTQKMADLQLTLSLELEAIQAQHKKLQAKRAEERRLLSQRTESNESESDSTPSEYRELTNGGQDKAKAAERKPALLSSVVSFAKTGIQGLLEKTSPRQRRRGEPVSTDDDTSDGAGQIKSNQVCEGFDNHDEFTRQMQNEGGLTYKGTDHAVHQLSYEGLPPPLSLSSIKAEASNKDE